MRRLGRMLIIGLAATLVLALVAGAWFALTFDPNAYRDEIAALVRETTGRELVIEGDLAVTLFPHLGIEIGTARLAQAPGFGATPFVTLRKAQADLRLWPLVRHRRVEIGRLRVEGVTVELRRRADGTTNWTDLIDLALHHGDDAAGWAPRSIRLSETEVDAVRVHHVDERAHTEYDLRDGSLRMESIAVSEPFVFDGRFRLERGEDAAQVHVRGVARIDGPQSFEVMKPALTLGVALGATPGVLTVSLDAPAVHFAARTLRVDTPQVQITSDADSELQVSGSLTAQSVTLTGHDTVSIASPALVLEVQGANVPGGRARLAVRTPALTAGLDAQTLSAEEVKIETGDLKLQASLSGTAILDQPRLTGRLTLASFSPRKLLESAGQAVAADPAALTHADLSARYQLGATALRLRDVNLTLDDTNITGEITLSDFTRPAVRFDLAADRLALDRYLAPGTIGAARAGNGFELRSDALGALDVEGVMRVAELTVAGLHARDVALSVNGRDGGASATAVSERPANPGVRTRD